MTSLRNYLISVVIAALICGILSGLAGKKSQQQGLIRLLCGIFLSLTVIKPLMNVQLEEITLYTQSVTMDAQGAVAYGEAIAANQKSEIIKQRTEAYILDKATSLGASLDVSVSLDEGGSIPQRVTLSGSIAPLAKKRLMQIIAQDLGIAEEDQTWIG